MGYSEAEKNDILYKAIQIAVGIAARTKTGFAPDILIEPVIRKEEFMVTLPTHQRAIYEHIAVREIMIDAADDLLPFIFPAFRVIVLCLFIPILLDNVLHHPAEFGAQSLVVLQEFSDACYSLHNVITKSCRA